MVATHGRRVVVTGIGAINPLGNDVETVWNQFERRPQRRWLYDHF